MSDNKLTIGFEREGRGHDIQFKVDIDKCPWTLMQRDRVGGFYGGEAIGSLHHLLDWAVEDAVLRESYFPQRVCVGDYIYSTELDGIPVPITKFAFEPVEEGPCAMAIWLDLNPVKDKVLNAMKFFDDEISKSNQGVLWDFLLIRDLTDCKSYSDDL